MMVGQVTKASFHVDPFEVSPRILCERAVFVLQLRAIHRGKELYQLNRCRVKDDYEKGFTHMKFSIYLLFYLLTFLLTLFIYLFVYACMFVCLYVCVY